MTLVGKLDDSLMQCGGYDQAVTPQEITVHVGGQFLFDTGQQLELVVMFLTLVYLMPPTQGDHFDGGLSH